MATRLRFLRIRSGRPDQSARLNPHDRLNATTTQSSSHTRTNRGHGPAKGDPRMSRPVMLSSYESLTYPAERDACGVGFIADIKGRASRQVLDYAITALGNLAHRGAVSADGLTGDGAGVTTQLPYRMFRRLLAEDGHQLEDDELAVAVMFIQPDGNGGTNEARIMQAVRAELEEAGLEWVMWRKTPVNPEVLGSIALSVMPRIRQLFMRAPDGVRGADLERLLYLTRKRIQARLPDLYLPSFSSKTISYKGLLAAGQLSGFYRDLAEPDYETAIALFHQRYSTNTLSSWHLAQPFRFLAHNGEINTLQGNVNFMRAREPRLTSRVWGEDVRDLVPIIEEGASDSGALDNALELLTLSGRDLPHALMMLMPQAYENDPGVDDRLRGFYEYHATLMEPWDGPAALAMSDGRFALAGLDRNGLRPQRYWLTADDLLVVASEAGVLPTEADRVVERGRLGPGRMLVVDLLEGRLLRDAEVKARYAARRPYGTWVERYGVTLEPAEGAPEEPLEGSALRQAQQAFGYHEIGRAHV